MSWWRILWPEKTVDLTNSLFTLRSKFAPSMADYNHLCNPNFISASPAWESYGCLFPSKPIVSRRTGLRTIPRGPSG